MDFSPDCQWLLCGLANASLCVVPMDIVTRKRQDPFSSSTSASGGTATGAAAAAGSQKTVPSLLSRGRIGPSNDATVFALPRKLTDVAKVLWWRTWDGTDLGTERLRG